LRKYYVEDGTRLNFRFNGQQFLEKRKEFNSVPERDVGNYKPEIRINED